MSYNLIQTVTVGAGGAANITFSSIPAGFNDLLVTLQFRTNRASQAVTTIVIGVNGVTTSFTQRSLGYNDANAVTSGSGATSYFDADASTATANTFSSSTLYIPNYAGSSNKTMSLDSIEENDGGAYGAISALLWSNTAAITSLSFTDFYSSTILQYSTASLYGIN